MTSQLRVCLLALVFLNLVFVQITGAVSLSWILPLFALTVGSPILARFQPLVTYRAAWNAALMAIFLLLIKDVRDSGVRYMLEDGLILAAFCQVHVLNNLLKQKRPDLILFNSFLIALVTSFFCQDLVYSAVFFIYAAALIFTLGISSSGTKDVYPTRVLHHAELRTLLGRSQRMAFVALLCTGLVFVFWPRDFEREGFVESQMAEGNAMTQVGFSDQITLDNKGNVTKSNRIVMRARLTRGSRKAVPEYWRGATFTNLQRRGWWADTNPQNSGYRNSRQLDEPWERRSARDFHRPGHRTGAALDITLTMERNQALFLPLEANRVKFECTAWPALDGNFRISRANEHHVRYSVELNDPGEPPRTAPQGFLGEHLRLRSRVVPKGMDRLHRDIGRGLSKDPSPDEVIARVRSYLAERRDYYLPGEPGAAEDINGFVEGTGGGHCEYFATTMVILLRMRSIPCRMVSGFLAHEWNEAGTELIVRSDDAHAWVEVWDTTRGWVTVDPTPPRRNQDDGSLLASARGMLRDLWNKVTSFDAKGRASVLAWLGDAATGLGRWAARNPAAVLLAVLALVGLRVALQSRRRRRAPPAVADYLGVLRQLGLQPRPGETPRQLLRRATADGLPAERIEVLAAATAAHEQARYA